MLLSGRDVNGDRLGPQGPVTIPINLGRLVPGRSRIPCWARSLKALSLGPGCSHRVGGLHGSANGAIRKSYAMEVASFSRACPAYFLEAVW